MPLLASLPDYMEGAPVKSKSARVRHMRQFMVTQLVRPFRFETAISQCSIVAPAAIPTA